MQAAKQNHGLSGGSCCRSVIAVPMARDKLFRQANTAQTASAIVPDFQREVCNVLTYRRLAASVITSRGSAVGLLKQ